MLYSFDVYPVCTDQLCALRDADWLTLLSDVAVLGVGADTVYAHREYARVNDVDFSLLNDANGSVATAYDARADDIDGHRNVPDLAIVVGQRAGGER